MPILKAKKVEDGIVLKDYTGGSGGDNLNYSSETGELQLRNGSNVLSSVTIQSGSGDGNKALISITATDYAGETVTLTNGTETYTETLSSLGIANIYVKNPGIYTAAVNDEEIGSVSVDVYEINLFKKVKFAFHYSENDSNPDSVTYPEGYDNYGWEPAHMDFENDKFEYGSWNPDAENSILLKWFYPRSCMLKYNCTVDYYLDENDETKKEDGTPSDVANQNYGGDAMMEWGQDGCMIWWKIVPDSDGKGFTFAVANHRADVDYHAWNHYDCEGNLTPHFYTPKYFGSSDGTRLRSISGGTNYVNNSRQTEINLALAANTTSKVEYYTEVYADWLLEMMLTWLITKSLNSQAKVGTGRCASGNSSAIGQGTMNGKGMFWGSNNQTSGVKAWGMENPWGNLWRAIAGFINASGTIKTKLTYASVDGSADSYNLDGTGYVNHGTISGTNGGYTSHMNITERGITPGTISGSDSTYYTDGAWLNNSQVNYAIVGGDWNDSLRVGAACCYLSNAVSYAGSSNGAAKSCKPLASRG